MREESRLTDTTDKHANAKTLLGERGLRAKKSFGQNFLMDALLAAKIADLAVPVAGGTVIEIGAGTGALTRPLLDRAEHVVAIERDRDLVPVLRAEFENELESGRLELIEADAKASDFEALFQGRPRPYRVAGNLPYQITGPLLEKVTRLGDELERVVFLVQLEVADRLSAAPLSPEYGALSVFVQNRFESRRAFIVRRGAFYPQPGVDSAVIVLEPRERALSPESETFRNLVRAAFEQRRKTLRNAWQRLPGVGAERLAEVAARAGIDLSLRGEALSVDAFARLARELDA